MNGDPLLMREGGTWQTLKKKIRHVLDLTDDVINGIQAEEDTLHDEMTAGDEQQDRDAIHGET